MEQHRCYGCMNLVETDVCPHCGYISGQDNDPNQLPVGTVLLQQYIVGKVLGHGGFGITYIGWDIYLETVVAIKEFYPASAVNRDVTQSLSVRLNTEDSQQHFEVSRDRFLREAKALAKLQNVPEVVSVSRFFAENNTAYIIMEYVRGTDLRQYVRNHGGKLMPQELFPLLEPVIRALDTVHKSGLVHRDVSPDNIMILPDGGAKLLDFGAVRGLDNADADIDLSHSTEAILKHGFAPMEQYRSRGNLGPWTDEYGLCASIYYCLSGKVPPDAPARAMEEAQPDWDSISGLTRAQRAALEKGMSMRAKERFGNLEELHRAIYEGKMAGSVQEEKLPEPAPVREDKKKGKGWLIAALLLIALLVSGVFWFISGGMPEILLEAVPAQTYSEETVKPTTPAVTEPAETQPPETQSPVSQTQPMDAVVETVEPWEYNVLVRYPLDALDLERSQIYGVSFLDSVETAPLNAVDVSYAGDGSVLIWTVWENRVNVKIAKVSIAAEGGINGRVACEELFKDCINLETISFGNNFHTEQAESMAYMFYDCYSLDSVDMGCLYTDNVRDMSYMFAQHSGYSWGKLDLQNFDTGNVENMSHMFAGRTGTYYFNISEWDMRNVWDISAMFKDCKSVSSLYVGDWNLESLENMSEVFSGCQSLKQLDLRYWNLSKVTDMSGAFFYCIFLEALDVDTWDVSSVENMSNLFCSCIKLKTLAVENWDVSNVTDMTAMFSKCEVLQQPDFSNWDVSRVTAYDRFLDGNALINGNYWKYFFEQG